MPNDPYHYYDGNPARDNRLRALLEAPASGTTATDTFGHWLRLLVAQRALSYPVGFASARVPAEFARQVAAAFAGHGFTARCSDPYATAESGDMRCVVTVWDARARTGDQQEEAA